MRRVEALDSRVNDNIDKTDAVIGKLRTLDLKLFHAPPPLPPDIVHQQQRIAESRSGNSDEGKDNYLRINEIKDNYVERDSELSHFFCAEEFMMKNEGRSGFF